MFCEPLIDWKSTPRGVWNQFVTLLILLMWFGIADRGFGQTSIDIVQVPSDVEKSSTTDQYFEVDNDHSSLIFAVSHAGLSYTYGRFEKCSGQILLTEDLEDAYFRFAIDVASINTNNQLRDDHLRGPEFLDAKTFSKIKFNSTSVKRQSATKNYLVIGTMSMHGVERQIEMPVTMIGIGKGPMGKTRGGFVTKFTIQRSDFGISSMQKVIGDQIAVTFSFEAILKDSPPENFKRFIEKK